LEQPSTKTYCFYGFFQQIAGVKAIESSGILERAMGIEPTSEAWEACDTFVTAAREPLKN
jgi:hypothetical protein